MEGLSLSVPGAALQQQSLLSESCIAPQSEFSAWDTAAFLVFGHIFPLQQDFASTLQTDAVSGAACMHKSTAVSSIPENRRGFICK